MGYAQTLPFSYVETHTQLEVVLAITNVAQAIDINNIFVPEFDQPPYRAYVDVIIQSVKEGSGAVNQITAGTFGIEDSATNYHSSGTIPNGTLYSIANEWWHGYYLLPGYVDIAPYLTSGASQMVRFDAIRATASDLKVYGVYGRLRMLFV